MEIGTLRVKTGLAEMLKGGVIMDVTTADQARIAEDAGACAVMALERVPADIRAQGGVARMADPDKIREIQEAVSIPVMAKARIGHFVEAQVLEALEVDYIDESEVLTPADTANHIDKWKFTVPFFCGCPNLGEALRRIAEGAAMIRTKGEAGTGDIVNAVTHMRAVFGAIKKLGAMDADELYSEAKNLQAPVELVRWVAENGRLPVVTFTAGGIATPADAALCMQLGADGVFVGSGIFKSGNPDVRAKAIVEATTHFEDAAILARVSQGVGDAMSGLASATLAPEEQPATGGREAAVRRARHARDVQAVRATWTSASFLLYAGGLVIAVAISALLATLGTHYGDGAFAGWSLLVFIVFWSVALAARAADRTLTEGLFAITSVVASAVLARAVEEWFGWLAHTHSPFGGFHVSHFLIELVLVFAALAALRALHF